MSSKIGKTHPITVEVRQFKFWCMVGLRWIVSGRSIHDQQQNCANEDDRDPKKKSESHKFHQKALICWSANTLRPWTFAQFRSELRFESCFNKRPLSKALCRSLQRALRILVNTSRTLIAAPTLRIHPLHLGCVDRLAYRWAIGINIPSPPTGHYQEMGCRTLTNVPLFSTLGSSYMTPVDCEENWAAQGLRGPARCLALGQSSPMIERSCAVHSVKSTTCQRPEASCSTSLLRRSRRRQTRTRHSAMPVAVVISETVRG